MKKSLTPSQQAVLGLLGKNLFEQEYILPENADIPALLRECRLQAVTAVALSGAKNADPQLTQTVYASIVGNNRIFSDHTELHKLLTENNVPYVILKGAASAHYYPKPILRAMGDVDFLVKPEDVDRATDVLRGNGFTPWDEKHICHIVFRKERQHLEMHFDVAGIPHGHAGEIIKSYLTDTIDTAELSESKHAQFMNPDKFHHGLIMLLHMQHHLLSEGIGLRHLCDWAVFVNSFSGDEFDVLFHEKLQASGLWTFAQAISMTAHVGIGLPYQPFMGNDTDLAESLLHDILSGGNFGVKDKNRSTEGMFISDRGKDGIGKNRITQFVKAINRVIYTQWPITEKVKFLIPFGWLFFGRRRLIRTILGKRKPLKLIESYKGSKERKDLYAKLHLFEIEY